MILRDFINETCEYDMQGPMRVIEIIDDAEQEAIWKRDFHSPLTALEQTPESILDYTVMYVYPCEVCLTEPEPAIAVEVALTI